MNQRRIEAELLQAPPRKIMRRRNSGWVDTFSRFAGVVFLWMALYFLRIAVFTTLISSHGVIAPARVTERQFVENRRGNSYNIYYQCEVGGASSVGWQDVGCKDYRITQIGDLVYVRFLASAPFLNEQLLLPNGHVHPTVASSWMYSLITGGLVVALSVYPWLSWFRNRKLLIYGIPVRGSITRTQNTKSGYFLHYSYSTRSHNRSNETSHLNADYVQKLLGKVEISADDYSAIRIGEAVTILYDARQPKRSLVYRYAEYECVK